MIKCLAEDDIDILQSSERIYERAHAEQQAGAVDTYWRVAGSTDVFEFLSAWSDIYSADAESSFLKAFATPFTDVKTSMR